MLRYMHSYLTLLMSNINNRNNLLLIADKKISGFKNVRIRGDMALEKKNQVIILSDWITLVDLSRFKSI